MAKLIEYSVNLKFQNKDQFSILRIKFFGYFVHWPQWKTKSSSFWLVGIELLVNFKVLQFCSQPVVVAK